MNIRNPTDYSAMFAVLDALVAANLPQIKLYYEIGRLVSDRLKKGAAVAAAKHLNFCIPRCSRVLPQKPAPDAGFLSSIRGFSGNTSRGHVHWLDAERGYPGRLQNR